MKTELKPFDLAKAQRGARIETKSGKSVRIVCYNRKSQQKGQNIVALVDVNSQEAVIYYFNNGRYDNSKSDFDLCIREEIYEPHDVVVFYNQNYDTIMGIIKSINEHYVVLSFGITRYGCHINDTYKLDYSNIHLANNSEMDAILNEMDEAKKDS